MLKNLYSAIASVALATALVAGGGAFAADQAGSTAPAATVAAAQTAPTQAKTKTVSAAKVSKVAVKHGTPKTTPSATSASSAPKAN